MLFHKGGTLRYETAPVCKSFLTEEKHKFRKSHDQYKRVFRLNCESFSLQRIEEKNWKRAWAILLRRNSLGLSPSLYSGKRLRDERNCG